LRPHDAFLARARNFDRERTMAAAVPAASLHTLRSFVARYVNICVLCVYSCVRVSYRTLQCTWHSCRGTVATELASLGVIRLYT
jgi:hypothetical protein